ncbi:hypothetical protein CBW65_10445 [Tumebacillus avium]|uniref:Uncharacterized protein n=1 Tax=Tumebacillus avium TaxID=1903704 RepID=A0A1Y0ILI5_9BACL|nr:hypothetical protein [Tumebacillus avium]ARU61372.1 hypothetical protein CBW65_10445 [Tumebacillus avium]
MKKRVLLLLLAAVILVGGSIYALNREPDLSNVTVKTNFMVGYPNYQTFEELEDRANVIVQARFKGDRKTLNLEKNADMHPMLISLSKIKVDHVFTGGKLVAAGDTLQVYEEGYLQDNAYFSPAGYKWMTTQGEYLLFLSRIRPDEYTIVGAYQGKFDYTITASHTEKPKDAAAFKAAFLDDTYEYFGEHMEKFNEHKKLAIAKYPQSK